jgi:hypothetical protein
MDHRNTNSGIEYYNYRVLQATMRVEHYTNTSNSL